MTTYWLRATDQSALETALTGSGLAVLIDGTLYPASADVSIDVIGPIMQQTGGTDEDPVFTAIDGYHCNLLTAAPLDAAVLAQLPLIDKPAKPWRVWDGVD